MSFLFAVLILVLLKVVSVLILIFFNNAFASTELDISTVNMIKNSVLFLLIVLILNRSLMNLLYPKSILLPNLLV